MKKIMFVVLTSAIGALPMIMTYVGFRSMWFASTVTEFVIGAITMISFGCGVLIEAFNIDKIANWFDDNEES